jgi:hypothetical protein
MPIFRPLIGMDKDEITPKRYDWVPIRYRLFRTRTAARCSRREILRPEADFVDIERAETALPIDELVDGAVNEAVVEDFNFPPPRRLRRGTPKRKARRRPNGRIGS